LAQVSQRSLFAALGSNECIEAGCTRMNLLSRNWIRCHFHCHMV